MSQSKSKEVKGNEQVETSNVKSPASENPNALYADFQIPRDKFPDERTFVIAGKAFMESRKFGGVKTDVVVFKLPDPFGDPDFTNSGGIFKYRCKKALHNASELLFPVVVTPVTFYSKKAKRELTIVSLFAKNPFADGFIEFHVHTPFAKEQEETKKASTKTVRSGNDVKLNRACSFEAAPGASAVNRVPDQ